MPGRPKNTPEVIWSKVDICGPDECWPWKLTKSKNGCGRTEINDVTYYVPRVIYNLIHPDTITLAAPKDLTLKQFVLHTCDNPSCCNPKHLFLGSNQDNVDDKIKKGRLPDLRGTRCYAAKLSEEDVQDIRRLKPYATLKALALLYDVSRATICGCLYGRHYQDVV
jgi:hypothetical protein